MPLLGDIVQKGIRFLKTDIWRMRLHGLPLRKTIFLKPLRIVLLASKGFVEDKCPLRASALTFYTLLSIVPVVAMAFGIAKGFGFENDLEHQLMQNFGGQEEILTRVIVFAKSLLDNTKGGLIAGIGVVVLLWAVIKVLGHIELSLNDIWNLTSARTFVRRFSDYLSIMLISPILVILSSSATLFIKSQVYTMTAEVALLGLFSPVIYFFLKLLPFGLIWTLLTLIYIIMPNTRVSFSSAFWAAVIAGTAFQTAQWGYINFQVGVARYNAIYGSFAALPLFLIWLQASWLIFLMGAEIAFAHQNADRYDFHPDCRDISPIFMRLLSLQVAHLIVARFAAGESPPTASGIAQRLEYPLPLVHRILAVLVDCGLFVSTQTDKAENAGHLPTRDIHNLSIAAVIFALEQNGSADIPVRVNPTLQELSTILRDFQTAVEASPANRLIKDLHPHGGIRQKSLSPKP